MTKEWTSYAQMNQALNSISETEDIAVGMSDEEELRRWKLLHQTAGIGEVLNGDDLTSEFRELGLIE